MIKLEIIDEHTWEKDETFFVQLTVDTTKKNVHLGKHDRTKVVVINDDGKLITGRKLNNFEIFIVFIWPVFSSFWVTDILSSLLHF